jgi:hypothetical protein
VAYTMQPPKGGLRGAVLPLEKWKSQMPVFIALLPRNGMRRPGSKSICVHTERIWQRSVVREGEEAAIGIEMRPPAHFAARSKLQAHGPASP